MEQLSASTVDQNELEVQEDLGDEEQEATPSGAKEIVTQSNDRQVSALHRKCKRSTLVLQPDFQRQFVWDRKKASRLIESVLLKVPLPIVYLSEEPDGREYVIDGQQRLTSLFSFIDGKFPNGDAFKLTDLTEYKDFNKLGFAELPSEVQERIEDYTIRVVTLSKLSDPNLKFEIFERLNTGSEPLNDMELRNCIYRGSYMKLLKEMAADPGFRSLLGLAKPEKRMRDIEFVLRFAAFYHATYLNYSSPMKRFFNLEMKKHQNIDPVVAADLKAAFKNAIDNIRSLLGPDRAFKRFYAGDAKNPTGRWEPQKFNASLFDVLMWVFAKKDKNQVMAALDPLREGWIELMSGNSDFIEAIEKSTSSLEMVTQRFDLARNLVEDTLKPYTKQTRCFSFALKKELFDANPTCLLCGQQISFIDDAAVDHIKQYWQGGQTIPENARLTHRYCNGARPRND